MDSYFFIPGTRLHKIPDIKKINVSQIIIDLEDAVKFSDRDEITQQLLKHAEYTNFYIRVPLYDDSENINTSFFVKLFQNGFRKFVFPKIQKATDFTKIISESNYSDLNIILLIETTRFFLEVQDILIQYMDIISGIGIGSHDFMSEVGGEHNLNNLEYVRLHILYLARMAGIKAIDIASMELKNEDSFKNEIFDGFLKGYDAKFFIHPWQTDVFKSLYLYSEEELKWATRVQKAFIKVGSNAEFNPVIINGQIIERPHLNKAKKIIEYYATK